MPEAQPAGASLLPCSMHDGTMQQTARSNGSRAVAVGPVPSGQFSAFVEAVQQILAERKRAAAKDRHTGSHYTPDFIQAVAKDAAAEVRGLEAGQKTLPAGGSTDVGQHSGHKAARDTSWALVCAVLQVKTCCCRLCACPVPAPVLAPLPCALLRRCL
jgi:hypothetical protein